MNAAGGLLGIDPGRAKAGFAVLDDSGEVRAMGVEPIERLSETVGAPIRAHRVTAIALGCGTNARTVRAALEVFGLPIYLVDEYETSRGARELYFADHPRRGWRRLIPLGLQVPERPIDDYAAILIARRFLARGAAARSPT